MIYYYLICFFILIIVIGILINKKSKEHYVNHYSGINQCGGLDAGPMDRPPNQPSCFYYNINQQNTLGNTVLHYLILFDNDINNYKDILIKKELDIFIKNKALYSPLIMAIKKKINIMDIVAESFINQTNKKYTNKDDVIKYILENKVSI